MSYNGRFDLTAIIQRVSPTQSAEYVQHIRTSQSPPCMLDSVIPLGAGAHCQKNHVRAPCPTHQSCPRSLSHPPIMSALLTSPSNHVRAPDLANQSCPCSLPHQPIMFALLTSPTNHVRAPCPTNQSCPRSLPHHQIMSVLPVPLTKHVLIGRACTDPAALHDSVTGWYEGAATARVCRCRPCSAPADGTDGRHGPCGGYLPDRSKCAAGCSVM